VNSIMTITFLTHRFVRLAIAAVAIAASTAVSAQQEATYEVVSSFDINFLNGRAPSSLRQADNSSFYGTASAGGLFDKGTLFRMDESGVVTSLKSFSGPLDGARPFGLVRASDGRFYGITAEGGAFGFGTVFRFVPGGVVTTLHEFSGTDRRLPVDLFPASDGNVYGLTAGGGDFENGTIFVIDSTGTLTTLHPLGGTSPGELIQGADGRLYGPTAFGGFDGGGTIIRLDLAGPLTTVYEFPIGAEAGKPNGVIQARNGLFYGTTHTRNMSSPFRDTSGAVFAMDPAGARTTLHTFFGDIPLSTLFEGNDGSLYGTTFYELDSPFPPGQIFRTSTAGDFTRVSSEYVLRAGVIQARDGRLYGTSAASLGPLTRDYYGRVFRVEANGTITVLHQFTGADSADPVAELVQIDDGSLYGTTAGRVPPVSPPPPPVHGTIFSVDPATGAFTTRYRFSGPDGSRPVGRLIQGTDGLVYGTTSAGGAYGFGTVFSLDAAGTLTTLHHFAGPDGANPGAGVTRGLDGRLYGIATNGGAFGHGTVFVLDVTGGLRTLNDFAFSDGAHPEAELIQASDGAFYGAASAGGPNHGGVIFRVRLATSTPGQYFELVSRNSGKCLDVFGASTDAVAPVIQWTCHGGLNQQWRLEPAGGGTFRIIARHSGQALDVYGAFVDDLAPVIQYPVHGGDNQVWTLEPASDGYVRIVARHSGKAMDVEFASTDDGARVIQYTPHDGANQQWLLRKVSTLP
jgi:uncharacterized repeat protein (TIGR03803 family)